jgi:hypothetical protein
MTVRVFFPKDVTQILHSLRHAPLALNTGSARQGRGIFIGTSSNGAVL